MSACFLKFYCIFKVNNLYQIIFCIFSMILSFFKTSENMQTRTQTSYIINSLKRANWQQRFGQEQVTAGGVNEDNCVSSNVIVLL